jgi:Mn2+/Fe2+ NRAMP family transporter
LLLVQPLGRAGFWLFVASLGIACLGATLEVTLSLAYFIAQALGWNWGKDVAPADDARFSLGYTLLIVLATPIVALGIDPAQDHLLAMALTATMLPLGTFPFPHFDERQAVPARAHEQTARQHPRPNHQHSGSGARVVSIPLEIIGG